MSLVGEVKQPLKLLRWRLRRAQAARRWGAAQLERMPAVIGNALPKSGSHLLIQVLLGLTRIGPFVDPGMPPLNRSAENRNVPEAKAIANLSRLKPGDIAYCYLHARQPFLAELTRPGRAALFICRDPRDVIVSQVFYATEMHKGHGMHDYYANKLSTMEARLNAAIQGVEPPEAQLSPIRAKYERYIGWLDQPEVLSLRFEDLVLDRAETLGRILDHLAARGFRPQPPREQAIAALAAAIAPGASGTFRRGQPGEWRQHFTTENIRNFKAATGDLLQQLGYEKDEQW
ncbi:MAG TPA: sulfotransferase domain-containing protein [Anaerolineales bacterium]|nr:sulfotransferase domain-containing protein [Anaerolineales bacterium]